MGKMTVRKESAIVQETTAGLKAKTLQIYSNKANNLEAQTKPNKAKTRDGETGDKNLGNL